MVSLRIKRELQILFIVFLFLGIEWQMLSSCRALPMFIRGRPPGGMLGSPLLPHGDSVSAEPLPPNMWLTQRLDHFHASDDRTWKQVVQLPVYKAFRVVIIAIYNAFSFTFA